MPSGRQDCDKPVNEIKAGIQILKALELRKGLNIISCPTCGRTQIDLIKLAQDIEKNLKNFNHLDLTIAVMGCVVNGPGEAREADYGVAGGKNEGLIFKKGTVIKKVAEDKIVGELIKLIAEDLIPIRKL